jgi:hypothetical protein
MYSLSTIYIIYHLILHRCATVKYVATGPFFCPKISRNRHVCTTDTGKWIDDDVVASDDTMFISGFMKIGQLDVNLNVHTTYARTHAQHGPQSQKPVFSFQKESRLGTLRYGDFYGGDNTKGHCVLVRAAVSFGRNLTTCQKKVPKFPQGYATSRFSLDVFYFHYQSGIDRQCFLEAQNFKPQDGLPTIYQTKQSVRTVRWSTAVSVCL